MIGQKHLIEEIDRLIDENLLAKFIILVGARGSETNQIIEHIEKQCGSITLDMGISVSDVREAITRMQTIGGDNVICTFKDADTMSMSAKNALLKIVEEPPKNVRIIMTVQSLNSMPETIRSRASVMTLLPYTTTEIGEYASKYNPTSEELGIIADICETPGEVDIIHAEGIIAFDEYVESVVDNIAEVSGANSFSIARKIKFKEEDAGFDLILFFRSFIAKCLNRMTDDVVQYAEAVRITTKHMQELKVNGINAQNVFDIWILDIREVWMD